MKRSFWIVGTAVLAVLAIGSGVTWWLLASAQNDVGLPALDTSELVYTGEDLAGFLLGQDAAQYVTGASIELEPIGIEYDSTGESTVDPVDCGNVSGSPTPFPAGFRQVEGRYAEAGQFFPYIFLHHAAYQFSTIQAAADAFQRIDQATQGCRHYVVSQPDGGRASDVALNQVDLDQDRSTAVAVLLVYSGYEQMRRGIVTVQRNNVITVAEVDSSDSRVDENMVQYLASAVLEQAAKAETAKASGGPVEQLRPAPSAAAPSEAGAWLIDFGSIGPVDITMTAQEAMDALGTGGEVVPDTPRCSSYEFGHNLGGLAWTQGSLGKLDTIWSGADSIFDAKLDAEDLTPDRPRTAPGSPSDQHLPTFNRHTKPS